MRRSFRRTRQGFILVVVISFILVMFVVVIGVLSRTTSRALTSELTVKRIQAEFVAKSAMWRANDTRRFNGDLPANFIQDVGGTLFTVNYASTGVGPGGTTPYTISVNY